MFEVFLFLEFVFNFGALLEPFLLETLLLTLEFVALLFAGLVVVWEGLEKSLLFVLVWPPLIEREGILLVVAGLVAFGLLAGLDMVCPPPLDMA